MSIADKDLQRYRFLLMYDDERVMDVAVALREQQGQDWWKLVIDLEEGGYAISDVSQLTVYLNEHGGDLLEQPLASLVGPVFQKTDAVLEREATTVEEAREAAFDSDAQVAVILDDEEVVGVLPVGTRSGSPFDASLVNLAGQYAELPAEGLVSKRRLARKKKKKK
ncbi:MAG: hypothetical protein GYB68_09490 [Chloroflexi bacterium]|nr:hypothetical protein [Chloroflexota bacterium]